MKMEHGSPQALHTAPVHSLTKDSTSDGPVSDTENAAKVARVCFVLPEIQPSSGRNLLPFYGQLFRRLSETGHQISVLNLRADGGKGPGDEAGLRDAFSDFAAITPLPEPVVPGPKGHHHMSQAYKTYEWVKGQDFDVVYFGVAGGAGFYCTLARHLGVAFTDTVLCALVDHPTLWGYQGEQRIPESRDELMCAYLEQKSAEWADHVVYPGDYLKTWMAGELWALPEERMFCLPPLHAPSRTSGAAEAKTPANTPPKALAFCGPFDFRHGLQLFCNVMSRLAKDLPTDFKIYFAGENVKDEGYGGTEFIGIRAVEWPCPFEIVTRKDDDETARFLKDAGALVLLVSAADHPVPMIEALLAHQVPFLASGEFGWQSVFGPDQAAHISLPGKPHEIAERVRAALSAGVAPAVPVLDGDALSARWMAWNQVLLQNRARCHVSREDDDGPGDAPAITVCLVHHDRPRELEQAMASLDRQTFKDFTVYVIDDGSKKPETHRYLDELEGRLTAKGWRLIRQQNLYLGAARNTGAREACSKYLMFMDDDNMAKPQELAQLFAIAERSGADVLTCFADVFIGKDLPADGQPVRRNIFCGANLTQGMWSNTFGDSNSLVRRSAFETLGGFHEEFGVGQEDQEFFVRAVLAGFALYVVPEALYWYRISEVRLRNKHFSIDRGGIKVFEAYMANTPGMLRPVVRQGHALGYRRPQPEMTHHLDLNPNMTGLAFKIYHLERSVFQKLIFWQRQIIVSEQRAFVWMVKTQAKVVKFLIGVLGRVKR